MKTWLFSLGPCPLTFDQRPKQSPLLHTSEMSFSTAVFAELCAKYTTWSSLKDFLVSEDGGKLRVVEDASTPGYAIVRYTKGVSNFAKDHVRAFRSVVWNTETNRPVSVAPFKAEKGEPPVDLSYRVSDFVDGIMIQGWRESGKAPRIATRTSLDAKGSFYSKRSFADLFGDCFQGGSAAFLSASLQQGQFVSFVLQHKEHRLVAPIAANRVFVTYVGKVLEDGSVSMTSVSSEWPTAFLPFAPQVYAESKAFQHSGEAEAFLRRQNSVYTWQGMVFQELGTARRWRIRNPNYTKVRGLRGAEASQEARFIRLRANGQMKDYLRYFREESNELWNLETKFRERTQALYDCYVQMHKLKTKGMRDFPYTLRPHVYALHGKYLASLSAAQGAAGAATPAPVSIQKQTVVDYVNALSQEDQVKILVGDHISAAAAGAPPAS